jgi:hypothetical protein
MMRIPYGFFVKLDSSTRLVSTPGNDFLGYRTGRKANPIEPTAWHYHRPHKISGPKWPAQGSKLLLIRSHTNSDSLAVRSYVSVKSVFILS